MRSRRGVLRVFVMIWGVLQLAVPPLAVVADAAATTASVGAHAHVEAHSGAGCARVHDAECVFCQFLSTGATTAEATTGAAMPIVMQQTIRFSPAMPDADDALDITLPRAPPPA